MTLAEEAQEGGNHPNQLKHADMSMSQCSQMAHGCTIQDTIHGPLSMNAMGHWGRTGAQIIVIQWNSWALIMTGL